MVFTRTHKRHIKLKYVGQHSHTPHPPPPTPTKNKTSGQSPASWDSFLTKVLRLHSFLIQLAGVFMKPRFVVLHKCRSQAVLCAHSVPIVAARGTVHRVVGFPVSRTLSPHVSYLVPFQNLDPSLAKAFVETHKQIVIAKSNSHCVPRHMTEIPEPYDSYISDSNFDYFANV